MELRKENVDPEIEDIPKKRLKLSLSKKNRYAYIQKEEMETIRKGYVPPNTEKNTKWALKCFNEWRYARNEKSSEKCPDDLLEEQCPEALDRWLSTFIAEVRRVDGDQYPPRTIHQLLSGVLRYMRSCSCDTPNVLDRRDTRFKSIQGACEVVFRELRKEGIGTSVRHAAVITMEEEDQLWKLGIMNITTPKGLQRAVFFYVGKVCCLRGGEEQRSLKISQFKRMYDPDKYTYTENGSKNRSGGVAQLNLENKIVPIYPVPQHQPRCLVYLIDLYFSKLTALAFEKDLFYVRPKANVPVLPDEAWYDNIPVGKNKLSTFVKEMFIEAGFENEGIKTNHSLRATGATCLFNAGVPEKVIQKTTGHRSIEALRGYERVSMEQQQASTKVLTSINPNVTYSLDSQNTSIATGVLPTFQGCSVGSITINLQQSMPNDQ